MNRTYKSPINGECITAQDEVQAAAFEQAGLELAEGTKPRKAKAE